jgi:hypothetical protein
MWDVDAHEAARLPMMYAAAWDVTKEDKYYQLYRKYITEAIDQSEKIKTDYPGWVLPQMQCSFDLLHQVETDVTQKERLSKLMNRVTEIGFIPAQYYTDIVCKTDKKDIAPLGKDWRNNQKWEYLIYDPPMRIAGEALTAIFMFDNPEQRDSRRQLLTELISHTNYQQIACGGGIVFHLAAYWKSRLIENSL